MTEVLNLTGNLDDDLHAKLNTVRSARNNWVHSMKPPTAKIANDALECAASLLAATWGRPVPLGLGLEASGL